MTTNTRAEYRQEWRVGKAYATNKDEIEGSTHVPGMARHVAVCNAADAPLIARAPEMDAAIRGLLDIIHDSMTHAAQSHHSDAINAARKAIGLAVQE